ncbi:MAG TPA: DUF2252 family protein [Vicinamibacterales bacterium]|nr:DUF2252 family protein [Vicinamibacterales bacterium]
MDIHAATRDYERWAARHIPLVRPDLKLKHARLAENPFVFLRGTFYRWVQRWAEVCPELAEAPAVRCVGDLHVENFGTWRDAEGRLVWGVNDVDEACTLPYTNDLVRLATSATLATRHGHFSLSPRVIASAILDGYTTSLERGGRAIVLAERRRWLRRIALGRLRDPERYWPRLDALPPTTDTKARAVLQAAMPDRRLPFRVVRRVAGVGSLGRPRVVALAEWQGGFLAREAKAILPSAAVWATGRRSIGVDPESLLSRAVRAPDPFFRVDRGWIVRRLAPDCSRIEIADMPRSRDEEKLLRAMGWETANIHLGQRGPRIHPDLVRRPRRWLERAAQAMGDAVAADWREWS